MNENDLIKYYFDYVLELVDEKSDGNMNKKELTGVGAEALIYSLRLLKENEEAEGMEDFIKQKIKEIMNKYIEFVS